MAGSPTTGALELSGTIVPPTLEALELLFDNISNAPVSDPEDVNDWNTFFDLPTYGTPFTSVGVVGNLVKLYGGSGITLWGTIGPDTGIFFNNTNLVSIEDNSGSIVAINPRSLETNSTTLTTIILNSCLTGGDYAANTNTGLVTCELNSLETSGDFTFGTNTVEEYNMPNLTTAGPASFIFSYLTKRFIFEALESIGERGFRGAEIVEEFYIPSMTSMGTGPTDSTVMDFISGQTITLTIPAAMMTINGGNPHASIQTLIDNNTVTVIEV